MSNYFFCYSYRLMYFIKACGINYIRHDFNKNNGLKFFIFKRTDSLDIVLNEWDNLKARLGDVTNERF